MPSRWVGVSDASIFKRTLGSDEPNNRIKYSNPEIDKWLHNLYQVKNETKMKPWIEKIQTKMNADLPYLPLFYWNNVLIFEKNLSDQFKNLKISPTGALEPYFRAQNQ